MKKLKKKQKRFLKSISLGVLLSLSTHMGILGFLLYKSSWFFPKSFEAENPLKSSIVETQLLSQNDYEQLFNNSKQVVESAYTNKQVENFKKTLLVSEKRNRVEKEYRAAQTGSIYSIPMIASSSEAAVNNKKNAKNNRLKNTNNEVMTFKTSSGQVERGDNLLKNNLPFGSMDSLDKNIAIGPQTILNTDEYLYSSFYNRFRYQVLPSWDPRVRKALQKKPQLGAKDYFVTSTSFLVGKDGLVKKVYVLKSSGISEFDEAAVASLFDIPVINNPPADLLNKDGLYEIKLQFIIELQKQNLQVRFQPPEKLPRHF